MISPRFAYAVDTGAFDLSDDASIVLLEPPADVDLVGVSPARVTIQQNFKPTFDVLANQGATMTNAATEPADVVHVTLPRSRELARGLISQAVALAKGGTVIIDGAKTDGIDAILKAAKAKVDVKGQASKAHGKIFWFASADGFEDWALADPAPAADGWVTQPGVFSADGPDAGSKALIAALPAKLKGHGADLGGGWGFLTHHALKVDGVTQIDLVEADKRALTCAERNISDDRVTFHWADATSWGAKSTLDWVVCNPPFHTSRTPDANLGQAFIRSAARLLKPNGSLYLVANRHLPYETVLAESFKRVQELDGDRRFKVVQADQPKPSQRLRSR